MVRTMVAVGLAAALALVVVPNRAHADSARIVSGGPGNGAPHQRLVAALDAVQSSLAVCWRAGGQTVNVELAVARDGAITRSTQKTRGPVAQCVAGVLAVQQLPAVTRGYTVVVALAGTGGASSRDVLTLIEGELGKQRPKLDACHEGKSLQGRVVVRFLVKPDGRIVDPEIDSSTIDAPAVDRCLVDTLRGMRIRALPTDKTVSMKFPLVFAGAGAAGGPSAGDPRLQPKKTGPLDAADIGRVMDAATPRFTACYEQRLRKRPKLAGYVLLRFTVRDNGTTRNVQIKQSELGDEPAERCLVQVGESLTFPAQTGRAATKVQYPFSFARR